MTAAAWLLALLVLALPRAQVDKPAAASAMVAAREVRAFSVNADDKDPDQDPDVVIRIAKKTTKK